MYKSYYGMEFNPFDKELESKNYFKTLDYTNALDRLEYLKETKGLGIFTGSPGLGKTFSLRQFISTLNPNLYKVVYIPLSTITVLEFYKQLAIGLGIVPDVKKVDIFKQIQDTLTDYAKNKKISVFIICDESQYMRTDILNDFKILLNFEMDSKNYITLILVGQPILNNILNRNIHEALKQRIIVNYTFIGIDKEEAKEYIRDRLSLCKANNNIFNENALEALYASSGGSIRVLNNLVTKCLIIGCKKGVQVIDNEIVMEAANEISL